MRLFQRLRRFIPFSFAFGADIQNTTCSGQRPGASAAADPRDRQENQGAGTRAASASGKRQAGGTGRRQAARTRARRHAERQRAARGRWCVFRTSGGRYM